MVMLLPKLYVPAVNEIACSYAVKPSSTHLATDTQQQTVQQTMGLVSGVIRPSIVGFLWHGRRCVQVWCSVLCCMLCAVCVVRVALLTPFLFLFFFPGQFEYSVAQFEVSERLRACYEYQCQLTDLSSRI